MLSSRVPRRQRPLKVTPDGVVHVRCAQVGYLCGAGLEILEAGDREIRVVGVQVDDERVVSLHDGASLLGGAGLVLLEAGDCEIRVVGVQVNGQGQRVVSLHDDRSLLFAGSPPWTAPCSLTWTSSQCYVKYHRFFHYASGSFAPSSTTRRRPILRPVSISWAPPRADGRPRSTSIRQTTAGVALRRSMNHCAAGPGAGWGRGDGCCGCCGHATSRCCGWVN